MRAVVVGMGKLGFEVASRLVEENHDAVVIDLSEPALRTVSDHLDVLTIQGNGALPPVLEKAEAASAHLLVAATPSDEVNLVACATAKAMGAGLCAARIRQEEYLEAAGDPAWRERFGLDELINPEQMAALEIARLLRMPTATYADTFAEGRIGLVRLQVEEDAPLTAGTLREVKPQHCVVAAVVREGELMVPDGDTRVLAGDHVYLVGRTGNFQDIRRLVGSPARNIREVVVLGGGKVGRPLVRTLVRDNGRGLRIKVIERDPAVCRRLADEFPGILVINGDGEKLDLLQEESVGRADAFVAVTGHDHTNLLTSMVAKDLGAREVIAIVSREDYAPLAEKAGADAVVIPRLLTASSVLKLLRRRSVASLVSLALLEEGKAQVLELAVREGARAAGRRLRDLQRIPGAIVGAILRDHEAMVPRGDARIEVGDRVMVFARPEALPKVEALFRG